MSGIRFIIALLFLIAGVETELRADVSHCHPADSHSPLQPYGLSNPTNKTSLEKLAHVASGMDLWILPARVMLPETPYQSFALLPNRLWLSHTPQTDQAYCFSGCSPPSYPFS